MPRRELEVAVVVVVLWAPRRRRTRGSGLVELRGLLVVIVWVALPVVGVVVPEGAGWRVGGWRVVFEGVGWRGRVVEGFAEDMGREVVEASWCVDERGIAISVAGAR